MSNRVTSVICTMCMLCGAHFAAAANITLDANTVIGADPPQTGNTFVVVNGANPPTVVDIVDGAMLAGDGEFPLFDVFGISEVNLLGGFADLSDHPTFRMQDASRLRISGGEYQGLVELHDTSQLQMLDGEDLGSIHAHDASHARILDGRFDFVDLFDNARIVMLGGSTESITGRHRSSAIIRGGTYVSGVEFQEDSRALIAGGLFVDNISLGDNAVLEWRNGELAPGELLSVGGNAIANIYGQGLHFIVDDIDGPMILGQWADGSAMSARYVIRDRGQIILHEVPEPASWALLAFGAAGVGLARRWRTPVPRQVRPRG